MLLFLYYELFSFRKICGISHTRGKDFSNYWPRDFDSEGDKKEDEWWRSRLLRDGFKNSCSNIAASYLKVGDDSMSAIQFCTMSKGDLPHLSYIFHKPEPLGTYFKMVAFYVT